MLTTSPVVVSSIATACWRVCKSHPNNSLASFGPSAVGEHRTVYSGRREAGVVMASIGNGRRYPSFRFQTDQAATRNRTWNRTAVTSRVAAETQGPACTAGGFHVPSPGGRMDGGVSFGQYKRMTMYIGPSGAGSQLAFLSPTGASF